MPEFVRAFLFVYRRVRFLFLFYATLGCIIMYTDMFDEPT